MITVPRLLPGRQPVGQKFRAVGIARDGTLVGVNESFDENGFDGFSHAAVLDGATATLSELPAAKIDLSNGMAADAASAYWLGDGLALWCLERGTGQERRMGLGMVGVRPVRTDRGHVVWNTYSSAGRGDSLEAYVAEGCGPVRSIDLKGGAVVALDWPSVYVQDSASAWGLRRVNAETGATTAVPAPPVGVRGPGATDEADYVFGADGNILAWTLGRQVFRMDLLTGLTRQLPADVPVLPGVNGMTRQVTVGAHTVAVAAHGIDGGPDSGWGLLYDLRTGRVTETPGEAWAAGPWTAWLDGDNYVISHP